MCSHMKVQRVVAFIRKLRFESSVISYGCQTEQEAVRRTP